MHSSGADLDPDSYTVEKAEWLAQNYPGDARRNAQNLEYFAIDSSTAIDRLPIYPPWPSAFDVSLNIVCQTIDCL